MRSAALSGALAAGVESWMIRMKEQKQPTRPSVPSTRATMVSGSVPREKSETRKARKVSIRIHSSSPWRSRPRRQRPVFDGQQQRELNMGDVNHREVVGDESLGQAGTKREGDQQGQGAGGRAGEGDQAGPDLV